MSFLLLCENENINDDLIDHIIQEATLRFINDCIYSNEYELLEGLIFVVQTELNNQNHNSEIFDYVFEGFYKYLDHESYIYESLLFENLSDLRNMNNAGYTDRVAAEEEPFNSPNNLNDQTPRKKNIFKRALSAVGRGISKITPGFMKQNPITTVRNMVANNPNSRIAKATVAIKNAIKNPKETFANMKTNAINKVNAYRTMRV